jgi:hypothetical protein
MYPGGAQLGNDFAVVRFGEELTNARASTGPTSCTSSSAASSAFSMRRDCRNAGPVLAVAADVATPSA